MLIRKTDYYDLFVCSGSQCPDTCCGRWEIGIDEETMKKYQERSDSFSNRLYNSIDQGRCSFVQYNGRCSFLNEEQLCDIYIEAGEDYLCETCKTYPRHIEEYPGVKELTLSISCPEVANIILSNQERAYWVFGENHSNEDEMEEIDEAYERLVKARTVSLRILQMRELPISIRMSIVLAMSHDLQRRLMVQDYEGMLHVVKKYQSIEVLCSLKKKMKSYEIRRFERRSIMRKMLKECSKLQVITPSWKEQVKEALRLLRQLSNEQYIELFERYRSKMNMVEYDTMLEQLVCYFVMNYYCTSFYDEELYAKMKFSIYSVLVIQELSFTNWIKTKNSLPFKDFVTRAYEYSREIEHIDENLNRLDRIFVDKNKFCLEEFLIAIQ